MGTLDNTPQLMNKYRIAFIRLDTLDLPGTSRFIPILFLDIQLLFFYNASPR